MIMDPRGVLLFRTVVRAGSLSAAARELGWTQPAVSQQLQRLERECGTPLLIRSARGVSPTGAGRILLARADAIAGELHMAGEELAALTELREGSVRLACFPSAAAKIAPEALRLLARNHPRIRVTMQEDEPPEATAAVREGGVDCALVFSYDERPDHAADLAWLPLVTEPVDLVVPVGHPAARRGAGAAAPDLAELDADAWIGGCPRCRQHLVETCRRAGFEPRLAHETDDYVAVQRLVASGLGVTMLPRSALRAHADPGVAVLPSPALGRRHVGVVHRPGAEQVPATRALLERLVHVTRVNAPE